MANLTTEERKLLEYIRFDRKAQFDEVRHHLNIDMTQKYVKMTVGGKTTDLPMTVEEFFNIAYKLQTVPVESAFEDLQIFDQYFIAVNHHGIFLVNTEGYDYCRYLIKLNGFQPDLDTERLYDM